MFRILWIRMWIGVERNVDCEIQCLLCEEEAEDDVHIFFTRASARSSW
jgi:hypothetical protein